MTDVGKIIKSLSKVEMHMDEIRKEIAALSEDTSKKQTTDSIREYFGDRMGLIDLYLRSIEGLLEKRLISMEEMKKLNVRLDRVENTVKIHEREIEELKKRLPISYIK